VNKVAASTSKAIRFNRIGGPDVLQWADAAIPPTGPGHVRLHTTTVAVNFREVLVRRGHIRIEVKHTYALRDAAQAHSDLDGRKITGSIALVV
jgi:NADPH:quinone reductase-like Zn-dependent oxidoreductase